MDNVPGADRDHDSRVFQEVLGLYDAPAYVRRGRQVQEVFDAFLARCRRQRYEWLPTVRTRLGLLQALAGDWQRLRPWLADEQEEDRLRELYFSLRPELRVPVTTTNSKRLLRQALRELIESIERFNRRWLRFLREVDLSPVNAAREAYNRYYLLEKECAIRSPRVASQYFQRLEPLTVDQVAALLPPLPVPRLKM
ncbi:MAG TPA: hypothetical protein VKI65_06045 [Gemmataceae bacterium]|nr:hypothetical protein [Gemmataceae bacterium]